jgi:5'-nucleotidase/UDP-sugar diphosphatase
LEKTPYQETGIGNLIADSLRATASTLAPLNDGNPYHMGIVGSGAIRDNLYPGKTGIITFSDIYNTLPHGISPDTSQPLPGYPLMSVYITARDIYTLCEVTLSLAPGMDPDYLHLNFSGIRIDYNPSYAKSFHGVRSVFVCPFSDTDPFSAGRGSRLDPNDTGLYHIVVDLYALQMLDLVNSMLPSGFSIIPRDKSGNPLNSANTMSSRIDANPDPGIQELKEWMALLNFLKSAFPASGPRIPSSIYGKGSTGMGRINFVNY